MKRKISLSILAFFFALPDNLTARGGGGGGHGGGGGGGGFAHGGGGGGGFAHGGGGGGGFSHGGGFAGGGHSFAGGGTHIGGAGMSHFGGPISRTSSYVPGVGITSRRVGPGGISTSSFTPLSGTRTGLAGRRTGTGFAGSGRIGTGVTGLAGRGTGTGLAGRGRIGTGTRLAGIGRGGRFAGWRGGRWGRWDRWGRFGWGWRFGYPWGWWIDTGYPALVESDWVQTSDCFGPCNSDCVAEAQSQGFSPAAAKYRCAAYCADNCGYSFDYEQDQYA